MQEFMNQGSENMYLDPNNVSVAENLYFNNKGGKNQTFKPKGDKSKMTKKGKQSSSSAAPSKPLGSAQMLSKLRDQKAKRKTQERRAESIPEAPSRRSSRAAKPQSSLKATEDAGQKETATAPATILTGQKRKRKTTA